MRLPASASIDLSIAGKKASFKSQYVYEPSKVELGKVFITNHWQSSSEAVLETNDWIEEPLYGKIRRLMPMAAVDILAVHDGRVLLMLRNNEPAKDCWFTPGGRIRYGETPEQAAFRELREETGLIADKLELKGVMSHFYEHIHYVTVFYKASVSSDSVVLNPEHRDYKWISHLSIDLHPYARQMIMYSRIFNDS